MAKTNEPEESKTTPVFDMAAYPDIQKFVEAAHSGRRQGLQGFDDDYVDIVDYIVRCTHKIWEEGGMGLVYTHYSHNAAIYTSDGLVYGREEWLARSVQRLAAFPNRRAYAHDVIWAGNEKDGYYTSHLVYSAGTNTGYSSLGPPTNRSVGTWVVSNCLIKENLIVAEWVVRDSFSEISQMGFDPFELALQEVNQPDSVPLPQETFGDIEQQQGQMPPAIWKWSDKDGFDVEDFIRGTLHEIWNWRLFNKIQERYIENYECFTVSGSHIYGSGNYRAFVLSLLGAFPDAKLLIDNLYWLGDETNGYRASIRWSLIGTHSGYSKYGPPTGKQVRIMGISQMHIRNGRFVKEYTFFDEFSLIKQLLSGSTTVNGSEQ